jgi:phage gp29-like protein
MARKSTVYPDQQVANKRPKKPALNDAVGVQGFTVNWGFDNIRDKDEYNSNLEGAEAVRVFNKMGRNDPVVQAVLLLLEMPITTADWTIEPPQDPTDKELEITEFCRWAIFSGMEQDFNTILRLALNCLRLGFSLTEKIYDQDTQGRIYVRKLAPRLQSTIEQFIYDDQERLIAFHQRIHSGKYAGDYIMERWKTVLWINRGEVDGPRGQSILRGAYKPWLRKEKFEKYQSLQYMRHGVGIPKITAPEKYTEADKEAATTLAANLRAHQQAYAFLPSGWELDYLDQGQSKHIDLLPGIKYCDDKIMQSVLAQFMQFGISETGSYSLSENISDIFLKNLEGTAKYIAGVIDREIIASDLVALNYPNIEPGREPKLTPSGIVSTAIKEMAEAFATAISSGAVTQDEETEDFMRQTLKMPKKQRKETNAPAAKLSEVPTRKKIKAAQSVSIVDIPAELQGYPIFQKRPVRQPECFVTWRAIEGTMDSAISQIVQVTTSVREKVIADLRQQVLDALRDGQPSAAFNIAVPDEDELATADAIVEVLSHVYDYGRETVGAEQERQMAAAKRKQKAAELKKPPKVKKINPAKSIANPQNAEAILQAMAIRVGQRVWQQLENTARDLVIAAIARGNADVESIMEELAALSGRQLETAARSVVPEAFGKGRAFEIEQLADTIEFVELSAALDANTCSECERLDRNTGPIIVGSPEYDQYMPPLTSYCLGGSRCRCLYVATFDTAPPEA